MYFDKKILSTSEPNSSEPLLQKIIETIKSTIINIMTPPRAGTDNKSGIDYKSGTDNKSRSQLEEPLLK